ncbi:MAG: hypothetical protein M5U01_41945 [Ardenticatenaceae bacterium]|nr:hypothetical protein [Ardenticatenaceae bacterium]
MGTRVYIANLTQEQLSEIASALRPGAPFAILERLDGLMFPATDVPLAIGEWEKGWLFGSALELRWEQQGSTFRAVLTLTDSQDAPADFGEPVETLPAGEIHEYYLWGEDDPSIGRQLVYRALPPGGRAKLVVEEFRDPDSAELLFYRYTGMRRG